MLTATWLAARTERIRIACIGPILNTYGSPMRAAEEIALLDNLTKGRLVVGLPLGHGGNYQAAASMNPSYAREKHNEAHDLVMKAFTDPGPFEWRGKHFHVPYANLWIQPVQKPHPPIFIPSSGSRTTFEICAENHYTYQALFSPRHVLRRNIESFREACRRHGYEADRKQITAVVNIHVAETDAQARLEAEPYLLWSFQQLLRSNRYDAFPPGMFTVDSLRGFMTAGGYRDREIGSMTYDELIGEGWCIVGSPQTVTEKLGEISEELGAGRIINIADQGSMPNWMVRKSLTLMAEEVIPHFRGPGGLPVWAAEDPRPVPTHAQLGAAMHAKEPLIPPEVLMPDGERHELRTSHLADEFKAGPKAG
jgi:alkanesulfonate monooxygenase SsuD/methylene tetrahydromethanopterin reductase-like flavin-dependent oxidoreductase (luciferase family)